MSIRSRRISAAIVVALLLAGGAAVWALTGSSPKEKSTLPQELQLASLKASSAEPGKLEQTMRNALERDDLTDEQRQELRQNMRELMESAMQKRVDEYFAAAPEDQAAVLDRHIDDWQARRAEWRQMGDMREARRREREGERGAGDDNKPRGEDNRRDGWRQWGAQSTEQRKARSEGRSPDQTARRMAYVTAMGQRAAQRGIEMPFGPGAGRGPGPRGGPP